MAATDPELKTPWPDMAKRGYMVLEIAGTDEVVRLAYVDTGATTPDGAKIVALQTAAGGGGVPAVVIIKDTAGDEAEVNAALNALQVDIMTALSGYDSLADAFKWVTGARSGYAPFEDTSFVVGDSPVVLDVNAALGRNGNNGSLLNTGAGAMQVEFSEDGAAWGTPFNVGTGEGIELDGLDIDSIRITWIADTAYKVFAN